MSCIFTAVKRRVHCAINVFIAIGSAVQRVSSKRRNRGSKGSTVSTVTAPSTVTASESSEKASTVSELAVKLSYNFACMYRYMLYMRYSC